MKQTIPGAGSEPDARQLDACIAALADGDRESLAQLYMLTSTAVYAFALSILKNNHDAEDVLQECYINIYHAASSYRSVGKPMAWIFTITKNLCRMRLRQRSKTVELTMEDWDKAFSDRHEMNSDDRIVLAQCMSRLSQEDRQIVVLHAVAGFKHRQIAELLQLPLATVLSKYARSIKKLKTYLERRA